jgi:hypothetical protein
MTPLKFHIGQTVCLQPERGEQRLSRARYTVVRALPTDTGDQQYRIKNDHDGRERIARESQLVELLTAGAPAAASSPRHKPS